MPRTPVDGGSLTAYLAPFTALAGDSRTRQLVTAIIDGILGSHSLVCARIAAFPPSAGGQSPC